MHGIRWIACVLAVVAVALVGFAQEEKQPAGGGGMMPAWMQKTAEHEWLEPFVGEWDAVARTWMMPGADPMETKAKSSARLILNGNYLEQTFKMDWMGQTYEGRLLLGYDTIDKNWTVIWLDSMSPAASFGTGKLENGVIHMESQDPDYMHPAGKRKYQRRTIERKSADEYVVTSFNKDGTRTSEIVYTRVKK